MTVIDKSITNVKLLQRYILPSNWSKLSLNSLRNLQYYETRQKPPSILELQIAIGLIPFGKYEHYCKSWKHIFSCFYFAMLAFSSFHSFHKCTGGRTLLFLTLYHVSPWQPPLQWFMMSAFSDFCSWNIYPHPVISALARALGPYRSKHRSRNKRL